MMVEGNIALVPDEESLQSIMQGLPAFFMGKFTALPLLQLHVVEVQEKKYTLLRFLIPQPLGFPA